MICCQSIFTPGAYDDEFHRLDGEIDAFARGLAGFDGVETWQPEDGRTTNATYCSADRASVA